MSESTSKAIGEEPTESWYREVTAGMPVSPAPAERSDPAGDRPGVQPSVPGELPAASRVETAQARSLEEGDPGDQPGVEATAPVVRQPLWSGKKTAVAAALAIGLSSVGVLGAAAVVREGGDTTFDGPAGGVRRHQFPGGQVPNGQVPNGQVPNGQVPNGQVPNGQPGPQQPGQLGQPNQQSPGQLTQPLSPLDDSGDSAPDEDSLGRATDT